MQIAFQTLSKMFLLIWSMFQICLSQEKLSRYEVFSSCKKKKSNRIIFLNVNQDQNLFEL